MALRAPPSIERLRQLLAYNRKTGVLTWRERTGKYSTRWNKRFAGVEAGTVTPEGYRVVKVDGINIGTHRIIIALVRGFWPDLVDHRDGDGLNNRYRNLRPATHAINQRNQKRHRTNTSGMTGVRFNPHIGKWTAQIKVNGQSIHLCGTQCLGVAIKARLSAEKEYGFTGRR